MIELFRRHFSYHGHFEMALLDLMYDMYVVTCGIRYFRRLARVTLGLMNESESDRKHY
jgi:hypothetical protein